MFLTNKSPSSGQFDDKKTGLLALSFGLMNAVRTTINHLGFKNFGDFNLAPYIFLIIFSKIPFYQ